MSLFGLQLDEKQLTKQEQVIWKSNRICKVFTWCQECWCISTEWPCQAFHYAGEVDNVLHLIFIRKVNFLQVYNKLQVCRPFYTFPRIFSFLWLLEQYWEVLNQLSEKFNSQEVSPEFPASLKVFFQLATGLCSVFYKLSSDLACLQSPGRRNIFKTLLILELSGIFNYMLYSLSTAC